MLIMLSGAYFFGYVIGSITNTVSIRNHAQNYFYETMDKLQAFIEVQCAATASLMPFTFCA